LKLERKDARVIVAMSGGVDSTMAAALLLEKGYDVIGVHFRTWHHQKNQSNANADDSSGMARATATNLGVEFHEIDVRDAFYNRVVKYFLDGYQSGMTPNPCVHCNRVMKWETLLQQADLFGAEYVATGHYARLAAAADGKKVLGIGKDINKDQSYVLCLLGQRELQRTLLPIGEYTKSEIREMAADLNLQAADRPDSQDLCFLDGVDYRSFLACHSSNRIQPGNILDRNGNILGQHQGLPFYTIGQRKGLHIAHPEPFYVLAKDMVNNNLIVGVRSELGKNILVASPVNWISGQAPGQVVHAKVKIRYKANFAPAQIQPEGEDRVIVHFEHPLPDISPGQFAVFYHGDTVLGGGMIQSTGYL
jgi:tRNA-specific 2-thiouridylase